MAQYRLPQYVWVKVEGRFPNPTRTDIVAGRHRLVLDELPSRRGNDDGMLPLQALMAALASCIHVAANAIAQEMHIEFTDSRIVADGKFDTRGFTGELETVLPLPEVDLTVSFSSTAQASEIEELRRQLRWRCPVSAQLRAAGTVINEDWKWTRD